MYKVVEMLRGVRTTTEAEMKLAQKTYTKVDCTVTSTMKKNAKLREENAEKIEDAQAELDALDSTTLTDEAERLVAAINAKKQEKKDADAELQKLTDEHDAYQSDLQAGIDALSNAQTELQNKGTSLLARNRGVESLLVTKLAPRHRQEIMSALKIGKQSPEAYESQLGTIITLVKNLILQYQQESIDGQSQFDKQQKAMIAMISELATAIADLQTALENGDGEAAAKMKRKNELQEVIDDALAENAAANAEDADMKKLDAENKATFKAFSTDASAKIAAIDKALDILHNDNARARFHKVADESGTFLLQKASRVGKIEAVASLSEQSTSAVATLLQAIDDFSSELDAEATSITKSIKTCTGKASDALESAKQAAEQVDGLSASIAQLTATIAAEQEKQKELTKKIVEETEAKEEANKKFEEEKTDLTSAKADLVEAARITGDAITALKEYEKPEGATTNPLDPVVAMLENLKRGFTNDADDRQKEIDDITQINTDMNIRVGTAQVYDAEKPAVVAVEDAESIIGGLEGERNVSLTEENAADKKKVVDETSKATQLEVLYGADGKGGVVGEYKSFQPGCDYWMINGPTRKDAIMKEKSALIAARQVLSSKDLGLAAGDEATLEARAAGADEKKHEQAHVE